MTKLSRKSMWDKHQIKVLVRNHGPISQVGIYRLTQLRRSTISLLTRQLVAEGELVEVGRSDNPLGRKQILLQLNPKFGYMAVVEFDDELLTAGVLDLEPSLVHVISEPTDLTHGQEGLQRQLKEAVRRVVAESKLPWSRFIGIGIADPGLVDTRNGVITSSSTIDFWNQVPLRSCFEEEFKLPTLVESRTRAKAIAERMLGGGEKHPNMIYLDYGTGIGAGVIVDGQLLYGHNCGVGEVGHTNILKAGPTCKCGSSGCLEALAGATAVEHRVRKALAEGVTSQALARHDPACISAWQVFKAASAGDKLCWNIVAEVADDIGIAVANLVNLFDPSIIVLDHRLRSAGDDFLALISRIVKSKALASFANSLSLRFADLGREAGLLGVGIQVLDHYFAQAPPTAAPTQKSVSKPSKNANISSLFEKGLSAPQPPQR
jgi:predicted NBD/HSP70 family sugar kinase